MLIFDVPKFDCYIRLLILSLFTIFGLIISKIITKRTQAEEALHEAHYELERRVEDRTSELVKANNELKEEIEERKRVEETLRKNEEKYRNTLEGIGDGYYEIDIAGNFTFFNDSLCKILGYSQNELLRMNNRDYTTAETANKIYQIFNRVYRTGEPGKITDYEIIRKDGTTIVVEGSTTLVKDPDGRPIGFRGVIREITERLWAEEEKKRLEAQLQQAQKIESMGVLANGMAHDFNNLLTRILGNIDIAKDDLQPGGETYNILAEAEEGCMCAKGLTRRFQPFSKDVIPSKEIDSLAGLIKDSTNLALTKSNSRGEFGIPDDLCWLNFPKNR